MSYGSPREYGKSNCYKQCQTYKWKKHERGSKKKNAELVMLKIYPTYTLLLHWLVVFILNVIDMNKNEQETKYDLLANEDNCIMNNKILIVIPLASKN